MLREGTNALGAMLGDGWYRGRLSFGGGRRNIYGDRLALLAQLEISYADGSSERIITDETWRAAPGPIIASDIYDGESYDARLERPGWAAAGYDDHDWAGVRPVERELATLFAPSGPPVRRIEQIAPGAISQSPSGRTNVDFGQNLVGWLRLSVHRPAGHTLTLRHAKVLEGGELSIRPLRAGGGGRLAASQRSRAGASRTGLPAAGGAATPRRRADPRARGIARRMAWPRPDGRLPRAKSPSMSWFHRA